MDRGAEFPQSPTIKSAGSRKSLVFKEKYFKKKLYKGLRYIKLGGMKQILKLYIAVMVGILVGLSLGDWLEVWLSK